jgi:hypothetical protein
MRSTSTPLQRGSRGKRGQGLTENILVIFLVAIALIGIVGFFGADLRILFAKSTDNLSGPQKEDAPPRENWRDNAGRPGGVKTK